jgi:hypothetical protein
MRYCTECNEEYRDEVSACSDCQGSELLTLGEFQARGLRLPHELDGRQFSRAATAEDPLTSQRYVKLLEDAGIPAFARDQRGGPLEAATSAAAYWEIYVPDDLLSRAAPLLDADRVAMAAEGEANARAAEEEAMEAR